MNRNQPRFLLVYPLLVLLFLTAHTTELRFRLGILLALMGEWLRLWANGYVGQVKVNTGKGTKIGRLVTAGPYAYVRHPLYVGSFLIGAGISIIVGQLWLSLVTFGLFLFVYHRKVIEEEIDLYDERGEEFERYRRGVHRWLPLSRRYAHRQGLWSWQGIKASKEWKTCIWLTVMLIALYFREEFFEERSFLLGEDWTKHIMLIAIVVSLITVDGLFELLRRFKKAPQQKPIS